MSSSKYPISTALTSFNSETAAPVIETIKKSAGKVHHLPPSIWKKMVGDAKDPLDKAIERTRDFFFREQLPDGYWWAELESNVTITSEYIMLFHFLGMVDKIRERKMARNILSKQTEDGSWAIWQGGAGELSATIEAYFALKLAGYSADCPEMLKAREFILAKGGILKARVFTKIFLALFGEFSWLGVPSMPVELMLLPDWAYFNMYEFSSWARATIIPLSVVMSEKVDRLRASMPTVDPKLLDSADARYATLERMVRERVIAVAADKLKLSTSDQHLARELQNSPEIAALRRPDGGLESRRARWHVGRD